MFELDLIHHNNLHNDWVFISLLLIFSAIAFVRVSFGSRLVLLNKSIFTYRHFNQFFKLTNSLNISGFLLPIFIIVSSLLLAHPKWGLDWNFYRVLKIGIFITSFFWLKYLVIKLIGHVFQQLYLFEEIIFISFLFEQSAGLFLFPFLVLSIYSPVNPLIWLISAGLIFLILLLIKYTRMIYIGFFKEKSK